LAALATILSGRDGGERYLATIIDVMLIEAGVQ
jgi:hypothetical protein